MVQMHFFLTLQMPVSIAAPSIFSPTYFPVKGRWRMRTDISAYCNRNETSDATNVNVDSRSVKVQLVKMLYGRFNW